MEAGGGMVAGSYKRNELVRIRHDSTDSGVYLLSISLTLHDLILVKLILVPIVWIWMFCCTFIVLCDVYISVCETLYPVIVDLIL